MTTNRVYLGLNGTKRTLFWSKSTPTAKSYGGKYKAVVGPFRSLRGAMFMRDHGQNNPHCQHVNDAERLAKQS